MQTGVGSGGASALFPLLTSMREWLHSEGTDEDKKKVLETPLGFTK